MSTEPLPRRRPKVNKNRFKGTNADLLESRNSLPAGSGCLAMFSVEEHEEVAALGHANTMTSQSFMRFRPENGLMPLDSAVEESEDNLASCAAVEDETCVAAQVASSSPSGLSRIAAIIFGNLTGGASPTDDPDGGAAAAGGSSMKQLSKDQQVVAAIKARDATVIKSLLSSRAKDATNQAETLHGFELRQHADRVMHRIITKHLALAAKCPCITKGMGHGEAAPCDDLLDHELAAAEAAEMEAAKIEAWDEADQLRGRVEELRADKALAADQLLELRGVMAAEHLAALPDNDKEFAQSVVNYFGALHFLFECFDAVVAQKDDGANQSAVKTTADSCSAVLERRLEALDTEARSLVERLGGQGDTTACSSAGSSEMRTAEAAYNSAQARVLQISAEVDELEAQLVCRRKEYEEAKASVHEHGSQLQHLTRVWHVQQQEKAAEEKDLRSRLAEIEEDKQEIQGLLRMSEISPESMKAQLAELHSVLQEVLTDAHVAGSEEEFKFLVKNQDMLVSEYCENMQKCLAHTALRVYGPQIVDVRTGKRLRSEDTEDPSESVEPPSIRTAVRSAVSISQVQRFLRRKAMTERLVEERLRIEREELQIKHDEILASHIRHEAVKEEAIVERDYKTVKLATALVSSSMKELNESEEKLERVKKLYNQAVAERQQMTAITEHRFPCDLLEKVCELTTRVHTCVRQSWSKKIVGIQSKFRKIEGLVVLASLSPVYDDLRKTVNELDAI